MGPIKPYMIHLKKASKGPAAGILGPYLVLVLTPLVWIKEKHFNILNDLWLKTVNKND